MISFYWKCGKIVFISQKHTSTGRKTAYDDMCCTHIARKKKKKKNYLHLSEDAWVYWACKIKNQQAPCSITLQRDNERILSTEPEKTPPKWNRNTSIDAHDVETKQVAVNLKPREMNDNDTELSTNLQIWLFFRTSNTNSLISARCQN